MCFTTSKCATFLQEIELDEGLGDYFWAKTRSKVLFSCAEEGENYAKYRRSRTLFFGTVWTPFLEVEATK